MESIRRLKGFQTLGSIMTDSFIIMQWFCVEEEKRRERKKEKRINSCAGEREGDSVSV